MSDDDIFIRGCIVLTIGWVAFLVASAMWLLR